MATLEDEEEVVLVFELPADEVGGGRAVVGLAEEFVVEDKELEAFMSLNAFSGLESGLCPSRTGFLTGLKAGMVLTIFLF